MTDPLHGRADDDVLDDAGALLADAGGGGGLACLARMAVLLRDVEGRAPPTELAARVVLEQLFHKSEPGHRASLAAAARELGCAHGAIALRSAEQLFVDLVRAAAHARVGEHGEARALVDACRERMRPALAARWERVLALGASGDLELLVRADALREEALAIEECFEVIAREAGRAPQDLPHVADVVTR